MTDESKIIELMKDKIDQKTEQYLEILHKLSNLTRSPLLRSLIIALGRDELISILMDYSGDRDINAYKHLSDDFLIGYVIDVMEAGKV
jgi:hypothetical protein